MWVWVVYTYTTAWHCARTRSSYFERTDAAFAGGASRIFSASNQSHICGPQSRGMLHCSLPLCINIANGPGKKIYNMSSCVYVRHYRGECWTGYIHIASNSIQNNFFFFNISLFRCAWYMQWNNVCGLINSLAEQPSRPKNCVWLIVAHPLDVIAVIVPGPEGPNIY